MDYNKSLAASGALGVVTSLSAYAFLQSFRSLEAETPGNLWWRWVCGIIVLISLILTLYVWFPGIFQRKA
jgi:hypothetical protein